MSRPTIITLEQHLAWLADNQGKPGVSAFAYVETGRYKPYSESTVRAARTRGYKVERACAGVYYVYQKVPATTPTKPVMTYPEFCAAANALLAGKPAFTGLRFGTGHLMHDKTGALVALAEGEPLDDAFEVDSSHWEDGVLEGMTPESIALALAKPDFCQFNQEIILLHAEDGCLQFEKGIVWRLYYGSSDYDTIAWPAPDMHNLRTALTTLRETSNLVSSGCEFAKLPDGAIVAF